MSIAVLTDFADGDDLSALDGAWGDALLAAVRVTLADQDTAILADWPGNGGFRRLAFLPNAARPASGHTTFVIDSEIDWRDRVVVVAIIARAVSSGDEPCAPGLPRDDELAGLGTFSWYAGAGQTEGDAAGGSTYHLALFTDVNLYAESNGALNLGALKLDIHSTAAGDYYSFGLFLWASEPCGERVASPPALPSLDANDGILIHPASLNQIQDYALLHQVQATLAGPDDLDSMPLGPVAQGQPRMPETGASETYPGRRQNVVGSYQRFFAISCGDGSSVLLDDSIDWRDRFAWGCGRQSTSDILPGGASEENHNPATAWDSETYSGPGRDHTATLSGSSYHLKVITGGNPAGVVIDSATGALYLRNDSGSTLYVTGYVCASFQLGPRSV